MEGVKVYAPDPEHVWLPGVICHADTQGKRLTLRLEQVVGPSTSVDLATLPLEKQLAGLSGKERRVDLEDPTVRSFLRSRQTVTPSTIHSEPSTGLDGDEAVSPEPTEPRTPPKMLSLPLQNADPDGAHTTGFEDMITIDHLHEASILYNLRRRFFQGLPYTYTGKICIAVNPYQWLNLYDHKIMMEFSDGKREQKPPHVYAVSMEAFFHMRELRENQSILVSGESGAGKTETTKIVMSHLASLASNSNSKVIQQIIQANPLLESFGNAKTVRNDNSSRFGKFTELQFDRDIRLIGARSRTYLLEKSRVTTQAEGERNFHIFYQMLKNRNELPELDLNVKDAFQFVRGSAKEDLTTPVNEEGSLQRTREALALIGIDESVQNEIFSVLGAILHLGETEFRSANGDVDASEIVDLTPFSTACRLVGVDIKALEQAVCFRNVFVNREVFSKPMTRDQATDCRDALAKSLYSKLFLWLVDRVNETIGVTTNEAVSFIGILDIFGFEHFEENSFEQFCINYANEKLQQKFVADVLKTVQVEYEEENISWSHIQFADNQDVLNLIEGRLGVISFLNEESLLATGTDAAFASKLGAVMENVPLLETPRLNQCAFSIYHYAGKVTYDANRFLDKNRDAILPDIKQVLSGSKLHILARAFADESTEASGPTSSRGARKKKFPSQSKRPTVSTQFKESLSQLMEKISHTEVHYVRCLKPNGLKSPQCFSHIDIVNQLRYAGVIEAIRVSRSAYPSRVSHLECLKKFKMLVSAMTPDQAMQLETSEESSYDVVKEKCEQLMELLLPGRKIQDYQVGLTRVYFREGILEVLETKRSWALRKFAITLQKNVRCYLQRKQFVRQKHSTVIMQKTWRRYFLRHRFVRLKRGVILCQAHFRGSMDRKKFKALRFEHSIVRFQALIRRFILRRRYQRQQAAAKRLQGYWRFTMVRSTFLQKLAKEKKNKELELKITALKGKISQKAGSQSSVSPSAKPRLSDSSSSQGNARPSVSVPRGSATGIIDESQDLINKLLEENRLLREQNEKQEANIEKVKAENRDLHKWQQSKFLNEKVQKMAHRDQESKDLTYLATLEHEYERLRGFICDSLDLPADTGSIASGVIPAPPSSTSSMRSSMLESSFISTTGTGAESRGVEAQAILTKSASRIASAKSKVSTKGSARRVKDYWDEIRNFPPSMQYTLGSVPWKRLLTDWAQGNPKKLDYMTRWLKNVLDGGPIVSDTFPMGVELKYVTPMMLDGFMQLVIPKLAERPDVQVHVHTKEFIGTSMRITLSPRDPHDSSGAHSNSRSAAADHRLGAHSSDMDESHRISVLANKHSGRFSTASTVSLSPSDPNALTGQSPAPSTSTTRGSGIFRSSRHSEDGRGQRGSFFQSRR